MTDTPWPLPDSRISSPLPRKEFALRDLDTFFDPGCPALMNNHVFLLSLAEDELPAYVPVRAIPLHPLEAKTILTHGY